MPTITIHDEDAEARIPLLALNCSDHRWSLGGKSRTDFLPSLQGDTLISRFAPNASGDAVVALHVGCRETNAAIAVAVRATPQPDFTYVVHEVAGADHLLGPVTVRINGLDRVLDPAGGTLQLRQGANTLELADTPGWRPLHVWAVNGLTIPLNLNAPSRTVTVPTSDDGGTLELRVLHATAHDWYRAGAQSEADVRALYWDQRPQSLAPGFQGIGGQQPGVYSPPNQPPLNGEEICLPNDEVRQYLWRDAMDSVAASYAGLPAPFHYRFANTVEPVFLFAFGNGEFTMSNSASLACEASIAAPELLFQSSPSGQFVQFIARLPAGATLQDRIDILWRLPRKNGVRVTGSPWVSSGHQLGPADRKVAEYFFPIADSAFARGMPTVRF